MDMSKDISLVNSDNESSIINPSDDNSIEQLQELIIGLQEQLKTKDRDVTELQTTLDTQKQTIENLENSNTKLQGLIDSYVENLSCTEGQNEYLKSTIISLNSIIEGQNQHLETAKLNIESYNSTIQKLQKELDTRENILCGKIDNDALETMIANENKVIANNQNLNNIILSFKVALQTKHDEINNLKSLLNENQELKSENVTLKNQLNFQGRQMNTLITEVDFLKEQITENIEMISRLITTKELLNNKLSNIQKQNEFLHKVNQEKCIQVQNLEDHEKLSVVLREIKVKEQETKQLNVEIEQVRNELSLKKLETHELEKLRGDLQSQVDEFTIRENKYVIREKGLNQQVEQLTQAIEGLQRLVELKNQEILILKAHIDETGDDSQKMTTLSKELEIISKDQLAKNETIFKLENKLLDYKSLKSRMEALAHEKSILAINNEALIKKNAHLSEELNESQRLLVVKGQEVEEMKRRLNDIKKENADIEAKHEKVVNERDEIVLSNEQSLQKILQLSQHLAKYQHDVEIAERDIRHLQKTLDENNKKYIDIYTRFEECNQNKQILLSKNETLSLDTTRLTNELSIALKDVTLKEQLIIDLKTQLVDANGAKTTLLVQVEELNKGSAEIIRCNNILSQQIKQLTEVRDKIYNELNVKKEEFTLLLSKVTDENNHNNATLQLQIEKLQEEKYELMRQNHISLEHVKKLNEEIDNFWKDLEVRNNYINDLEIKLKEAEKINADLSINQLQLYELSDIKQELVRQSENLKQHTVEFFEKFSNLRSELVTKNQDVIDLKSKLNDVKENNEHLRNALVCKENMISLLQHRVTSLYPESQTLTSSEQVGIKDRVNEIDSLKSEIKTKENKIEELGHNIQSLNLTLDEQLKKSNEMQQKLEQAVKSRKNILKIVFELTKDVKIEPEIETKSANPDENDVDCVLDVVRRHVISLIESKDNEHQEIKQMLIAAKEDIIELTQKNVELMSVYTEMEIKNQDLWSELEKVSNINRDLLKATEFMAYLKCELSDKCIELTGMETKVKEWKDQFTYYEDLIRKQMVDLQLKKYILKDLEKSWQLTNIRHNSPQSLLTICCNKIIETLQLKENSISSEPSVKQTRSVSKIDATFSVSKPNIQLRHVESNTNICICSDVTSELKLAKRENGKLNKIIKDLESSNKHLLEEREQVHKEIQQLVEPAIDLQKKISNHRTNLSTLTATTYAENKLLNSQLKVLKHYHTRYIHVCQRDIPAVKSQLHELMSILKDNSSFLDKQNTSFKRYSLPDVLDDNSMISNFKNESTLDGDLLMLDTNVTLTTSADNTLIGHGLLECSPKPDYTCLDVTQIHFDSEVACQTNDLGKVIDPHTLNSQIESLTNDNHNMIAILESLKVENTKLKEEINNQRTQKDSSRSVDAQNSPIKFIETCDHNISSMVSEKCKHEEELDKLLHQMKSLTQELQEAVTHKISIEKKYNDLVTEIPATTALAKRLSNTEIDCQNKMQEVAKLTKDLDKKNCFIKELEDENISLSTQVMENITEADELRKELDTLKDRYSNLVEKCTHLERKTNESEDNINHEEINICSQCAIKDFIINSLKNKQTVDPRSKLNRSLSDSESSSRLNKLNTLQSELHASKEDCKKITEEVATIKNHLEQSDLSMSLAMDMDESMGEPDIFSLTKFKSDEQHLNRFMPNIPEERPTDSYTLDKIDCFNFYADKTGIDKENLSYDMKIIDVLKLLYDNLIAKHGNEVQNLLNKLKDIEETKNQLQSQIGSITAETMRITKSLEEKENDVKNIKNVFTQIKSNINAIDELSYDNQSNIVSLFKDKYLDILDTALDLSSKSMFESLIDSIGNKHQNDLKSVMEKYTKSQDQLESVFVELNDVSENLNDIRERLSTKENEFNLLKDQKERIHEISNAVTLDIVKRDRELGEIVKNSYDRLVTLKVISTLDLSPNLPINEKIKLFLDSLSQSVIKIKSEGYHLQEVENLKTAIEVKQKKFDSLKLEMAEKERILRNEKTLYDDLSKLYHHNFEENQDKMEKLKSEINLLKDTLLKKDEIMQILDGKLSSKLEESFSESINEFMQKIQNLEQENANLKSVNQMIAKEKEILALELEKSAEMIRNNKMDIDKMTTYINVLTGSVSNLTLESKSLLENNTLLKKQYEEKSRDCTQLQKNIKIFEKTAEIQNKTILR